MEKLTRKQATEYIRDPANWEIIPGNQYVRASRLKWPYKNKEIIAIETLHIANVIGVITEEEEPVIEFTKTQYMEIEPKSIGTISETALAFKLYEYSRKAE